MPLPSIGVFMVVSPGETELAADSLRRALAHAPDGCEAIVVNNGACPDIARWWTGLGLVKHSFRTLPLERPGPRPYFEIARTIFGAFHALAPAAPGLVFKIDPDTLVLDRGFFTDICDLHARQQADFYACHANASRRDHFNRALRRLADFCPAGAGRSAGADRYGSALRLRLGRVWFSRLGLAGLGRRAQPSGGFYAIRGGMLATLAQKGLLATHGANGLEWNDDTLLPVAVRAAGGRIFDVRSAECAPGWRCLHGSRYFDLVRAREPGLRALHPVKLDEFGRALRASLGLALPPQP